ncbi:MAG: hypothetical protein KTR14_09695 [Vampirovibrio sp.]|nr:hypothetical protein [Vampirovibrio sp.]
MDDANKNLVSEKKPPGKKQRPEVWAPLGEMRDYFVVQMDQDRVSEDSRGRRDW